MRSDFSDPLAAAGVVRLSAIFAGKTATPVEALNLYLSRIERLNPTLNAFLAIDRVEAGRDAQASRSRWAKGAPLSPLDGAPIGIKANIAVKGMPWHAGIAAYADRMADADAACVAKLRKAGAVIIGVLNMHEAGLGATNDNLAFGRCHNPYRPDFTPGGSSGGGAAAVAAGLCAAAVGTDTLGSVRIPASYCGVFGYKPVHGLASTVGVVPLSPTLDDLGVNARSAQDCKAVFDVLTADGAAAAPSDRGARVGVIGLPSGGKLHPGLEAALSLAVETLSRSEVRVELIDPSWGWAAMRRAALTAIELEARVEHAGMLALKPDGFSPQLRAMLDWAEQQSAQKALDAYRALSEAGDDIRRTLSPFDAVLSPSTAFPAFAFEDEPPADQADFTMIANIAGLASVAFPVGVTPDGLPISLQTISRDGDAAIAWAEQLARPAPPPPQFRN